MMPSLSLSGRIDSQESHFSSRERLARAAVWFETVGDAVLGAEVSVDEDGQPLLYVSLHPAADDLEVRIFANGQVRASAVSAIAGPGYHATLRSLLADFADDFDITWEQSSDPTGYFVSGDFAHLQKQFVSAMHHLAKQALLLDRDGCPPVPKTPIVLGLPVDHGFTHPGPVLTPSGPRSLEWLAECLEGSDRAAEFYPWWNLALDASFYLRRALALMWCEFPWRAPLTESEGELTDQIAADLEEAYSLDPHCAIPWAEWSELFQAIENDKNGFTMQGVDPKLKAEVARHEGLSSTIGYRRFPLKVELDEGVVVEVPGTFADRWNEENRVWTGFDEFRRLSVDLDGRDENLAIEPMAVARESRREMVTRSRRKLAVLAETPFDEDNTWIDRAVGSLRQYVPSVIVKRDE